MKDENTVGKYSSENYIEDIIPFLDGRPHRETVIEDDDILNLSIALHVSKTTDEFLKNI